VIHLRKAQGIGEAAGLAVLGAEQKRTLGKLVSELKKNGIFEEDIETRLTSLVDERNWLVHRAKRENRGLLNDMARLDRVVERIDRLAAEATALNTLLGEKFYNAALKAGVAQESIDQEVTTLLAEWGY